MQNPILFEPNLEARKRALMLEIVKTFSTPKYSQELLSKEVEEAVENFSPEYIEEMIKRLWPKNKSGNVNLGRYIGAELAIKYGGKNKFHAGVGEINIGNFNFKFNHSNQEISARNPLNPEAGYQNIYKRSFNLINGKATLSPTLSNKLGAYYSENPNISGVINPIDEKRLYNPMENSFYYNRNNPINDAFNGLNQKILYAIFFNENGSVNKIGYNDVMPIINKNIEEFNKFLEKPEIVKILEERAIAVQPIETIEDVFHTEYGQYPLNSLMSIIEKYNIKNYKDALKKGNVKEFINILKTDAQEKKPEGTLLHRLQATYATQPQQILKLLEFIRKGCSSQEEFDSIINADTKEGITFLGMSDKEFIQKFCKTLLVDENSDLNTILKALSQYVEKKVTEKPLNLNETNPVKPNTVDENEANSLNLNEKKPVNSNTVANSLNLNGLDCNSGQTSRISQANSASEQPQGATSGQQEKPNPSQQMPSQKEATI